MEEKLAIASNNNPSELLNQKSEIGGALNTLLVFLAEC